MARVAPDETNPLIVPQFAPVAERPTPAPDFGSVLGAGFQNESPVYAAWAWLNRDTTPRDPNWDAQAAWAAEPLMQTYPEQLARAQSQAEFDSIRATIQREQGNQRLLASAGWKGFVAAAAGGFISPTTLIPFTGQARGAKGVAEAFALASGAALADEATLYGLQETRTGQELVFGVAAGTVLGGLLGSAAVVLRRGEAETIVQGMANPRGEMTISRTADDGSIVQERFDTLAPTPSRELTFDEYRTQIVPKLDAAEATLSPEAGQLLTDFVGFAPGRAREGDSAIMNAQPLERALREGGQLIEELSKKFNEVRNSIRETYGDYITLYRYQRPVDSAAVRGSAIEGNREALSWTINPAFAREFADVQPSKKLFSEADIKQFEEIFARTGEVQIPGTSLTFRKSDDPENPYVDIYKGEEYITDTDSVSHYLKGENDYYTEYNATQAAKEATIVKAEVSVDDIVWATERAHQAEFIVRNKEGSSGFIDQNGKFAGVPPEPKRINLGGEGGSLSAARAAVTPSGIARRGPISGAIIDTLAKLNPLTRSLNSTFASLRSAAARLQNPGIKLEGTEALGPAARDGTIYDRANVHQTAIADFVVEFDQAYVKHIYGNAAPKLTQKFIAILKSGMGYVPPGKLSYVQFREQAFDLLNKPGDPGITGMNEAVAAGRKALNYFEKIADQYHDYRKAFQGEDAAPLFKKLEMKDGDEQMHYMHHMYDSNYIIENTAEFLSDLETHGRQILEADFRNGWNAYNKTMNKGQSYIDLLELDEARANDFLVRLEEDINDIDTNPDWANGRQRITELRKNMRTLGMDEADIRAEAKALEDNLGPEYSELDRQRREYMKQRNMLLKIGANASEAQQKLLDDVADLEAMQYRQLDRVAGAALRVQKKLAKLTDDILDAEADKAVKEFQLAVRGYNLRNKQLEKARGKDELTFESAESRIETAETRLARAAERIEKAKTLDREAAREMAAEALDLAKKASVEANAKRAVRANKLKEKAKLVSPEEKLEFRKNEAQRTREAMFRLEEDFDQKWRERGATDFNARTGVADFAEQARQDAQLLFNKVTGSQARVVGLDMMAESRGPQLARTLNLPFATKRKYLVRDPEYVIRSYAHTMAPDLELYRATGSPNGKQFFKELDDEIIRKRDQIAKDAKLTPAQREKAFTKLKAQHETALADLTVLIDRLRHRRAIPDNPNGFTYRAGRMFQSANVFRFMGTVVPSSLPDLVRPLFYFGLNKTFSKAWLPLTTDLKARSANRAAALRAGIGLDPILHNRAHAIFDIGENYSTRQSGAEKGVEFLANKTGVVALFDYWNAFNKRVALSVTNAELSNAIRVIATGVQGKERQLAKDLLSDNNIGEEYAGRIWGQFNLPGGADEFSGLKIPNTGSWTDPEAVMAYNTALNKLANSDMIITPGLDRPSWVDQNLAFKLVAQFRSFTFSSTNRIMMAGLQRQDMALLQGATFSLALGAISYYTWAMARGGTSQERMQNATAEEWVYESLNRSSLLGALSEGMKLGEQIPALNDYAVFGGEARSTRQASSIMGQLLGPSYDMAERLINIVQGIDSPTQSTLHQARVALVPYQNVFYLARLIDKLEQGTADLLGIPERRGN